MNSNFVDLLRLLNEFKARYLVIGGYAVGVHAEPRYTKDLDIWIESSRTNANRVYRALEEFGAPLNSLAKADLSEPGTLFIFGVAPSRVDILNRIEGADFKAAYARKVTAEIDGLKFACIGLDDLILLKKIAGRPQDRLDIANLKKAKKASFPTPPSRRRKR